MRGIDKEIAEATKIPVRLADDPLTCVVRGTGILLSDPELLEKVIRGPMFTAAELPEAPEPWRKPPKRHSLPQT